MLILHGRYGTSLNPIHMLDLLLIVNTLAAELTLFNVIARDEVTFSSCPIRVAIVSDPAGMRLLAELRDSLVNLAKLYQSQAVFLQRLVVLTKLCHVESKLIVISLNLGGQRGHNKQTCID